MIHGGPYEAVGMAQTVSVVVGAENRARLDADAFADRRQLVNAHPIPTPACRGSGSVGESKVSHGGGRRIVERRQSRETTSEYSGARRTQIENLGDSEPSAGSLPAATVPSRHAPHGRSAPP